MLNVSNISILALEEEKVQNSESQFGNSCNSQNSKDIDRRERRLMQNRKSASKLRVKKKHNMQHLMVEKDQLKETNDELFETMTESLNLRKRIDEVQTKQNDLLMSYFQQNQDSLSDASSRRSSDVLNSNFQNFGKQIQMNENILGANQYILGSQTFDFQNAMNLLMGAQVPLHPNLMTSGAMNSKPQTLNFQNTSNLRETVQTNLRQSDQTPTAFSKILNVLTKEHLRNVDSSAFSFPN